VENRILLLALRGRDAAVISQILSRENHVCQTCYSVHEVARELEQGAGTTIVTEESLVDADRRSLDQWLDSQPPWSDFPFILLATKRAGRRSSQALSVLERLGNVIVLERPIHSETLSSAVKSALRARRKQYEARRHLIEISSAEERVRQLNGSLEMRIAQRTAELSAANNQLMQEVAERERAQEALVQSQKMEAVGQLTGGIAHDFNNLLTVIGGNVELIQHRATDQRITRLADFARQATDRAAKLTHQLLAFSRTQKLTLSRVDLNALIAGMSDLLDRTIGPMMSIEMELQSEATWAMADAHQFELAILNLVINARDAMPDGGVLRLSSTVRQASNDLLALGEQLKPGEYVVVQVSDTGTGIPKKLLERVFDPFFTTKPAGAGTGLGLSQVYGIAQQSGGTVQIESREGEGTTVSVWLPRASPQPASDIAAPRDDHRPLGRRENVLVVEDDAGVRRFIVECLELLGHSTVEARNGQEGLTRLAKDMPGLMIVDFAMPGMNGAEVVAEARTLWPRLPIILATGYADMDAVHKVIDPANVLRKPFKIDELDKAMRYALAESREA
jgi:signal transduction histidine kinase/ActR/RegA family two-component response regulator